MKVLVAGNLGYVGPLVVAELRRQGHEVWGFDAGYFEPCLTVLASRPLSRPDCQLYGDIRNFPVDLLVSFDSVVCLAAISNDPMGKAFEAVTDKVNCLSTVALAALSRVCGVESFVFASSCSVYGNATGVVNEDAPVNPLTAYARSKIEAELALRRLADSELAVTCLRFATACGMSDRLRLDLVLNDFVTSALVNRCVELKSSGMAYRPLIDVSDMARACAWAASRRGSGFSVYNTGQAGWNFRIRDLAEAVGKQFGVPVKYGAESEHDTRSYQVDFARFAADAPGVLQGQIEETLCQVMAGLHGIGFDDSDFRNSHFARLPHLRYLIATRLLDNQLNWIRE